MEDWEKNPEKYLTNPDGSYILNKDGKPRKKGGRPKNSELSDVQLAIKAQKQLVSKNKKVKKLTRHLAKIKRETEAEEKANNLSTKITIQADGLFLIENDLLPNTIQRIRNANFEVIQYRIA